MNDDLSLQSQALKSATTAFYNLIVKLENDGYLKAKDETYKASGAIMTEVAAFSIALILEYNSEFRTIQEEEIYNFNSIITNCFEDGLLSVFDKFIQQMLVKISDFNQGKVDDIEFTSVNFIDNFDKMAQVYEGAFYNNLGITNPGPIKNKLEDLIYSYLLFAKNYINSISSVNNSFFDKIISVLGEYNED